MLRTYDPKNVSVIVGLFPIGGFADGKAIRVVRSTDTFEMIHGIGGVISRAKTLDKSGEITLTLEQTSMSNDILSGLMIADDLANSGVVPVLIVDTSTKSVFVSAFAWIKKPAEVDYSKTLSQREWTLDAVDIDVFIGGNVAYN